MQGLERLWLGDERGRWGVGSASAMASSSQTVGSFSPSLAGDAHQHSSPTDPADRDLDAQRAKSVRSRRRHGKRTRCLSSCCLVAHTTRLGRPRPMWMQVRSSSSVEAGKGRLGRRPRETKIKMAAARLRLSRGARSSNVNKGIQYSVHNKCKMKKGSQATAANTVRIIL
jgi:hypothetical protein